MPVVPSSMPSSRGRPPPAVVELQVCAGAIIQAGEDLGGGRLMQVSGPDGSHSITVMGQLQEAFMGPQESSNPADREMSLRQNLNRLEKQLGGEHPEVATAVQSLAEFSEEKWQWREAEELHRRNLQLQEKAVGSNHPNTAIALEAVARCAVARSGHDEAERLLLRALQIRRYGMPRELASCLEALGGVYVADGHPGKAVGLLAEAIAALDTNSPEVPPLLLKLSGAAAKAGNLSRAENAVLQAMKQLQQDSDSNQEDLIAAHHQKALLEINQNNHQAAEADLRKRLSLQKRLRGEKHLETAQAGSDLAVLLAVIGGKAEESESLFQQSIDILEGISGLQPIRLAKTFLGYADLLRKESRLQDSEILYQHCCNLLKGSNAWHQAECEAVRASVQKRLGTLLMEMDRGQEAEKVLRQALDSRRAAHGKSHLKVVTDLQNLGCLLVQLPGKRAEAMSIYTEAISLMESMLDRKQVAPEEIAEPMNDLGMLLKQCDRYVEGEKLCEKADALLQNHLDPEQRDLEEFIRTGEVSQAGPPPPLPEARPHDSPHRPFVDDMFDMCPSPKARAPSRTSARKGTRAEAAMSQEILQRSMEFRQWAESSMHLEEALASWRAQQQDGGIQHQRKAGSEKNKQGAEAMASKNKPPISPDGKGAPSADVEILLPKFKRYTSFDLEESMAEIEEESLIKVGQGGRQDSDNVLIGTGTLNFDSLGMSDSTWDYGVSNQEPVRMMLDLAKKQNNEAAFQPGRRNNKNLLESSEAEDIDVDMLLQTFSSTDHGRQAVKLDDSIDETIYDMIESARLEDDDSNTGLNKGVKGRWYNKSGRDSIDEIALTSMNMEDIEELLET